MTDFVTINPETDLSEITENVVADLLTKDVHENLYFDFKAVISASPEYNHKVRISIASFANTLGGFVFFGIEDGKTKRGLERLIGVNQDAELGKEITDLLPSGLCVPTIQFEGPQIISIEGKSVAVIKVNSSENKPHAVRPRHDRPFEFWGRGTGTGKVLDYFEIIELLKEGREKREVLIATFLDMEEVVSVANSNIASRLSENTLPRKYHSTVVREWGRFSAALATDIELLRGLFPLKQSIVGADDQRDYLFSQTALPLTNKTQLVKTGNDAAALTAERIKGAATEIRDYLFSHYPSVREFVGRSQR